MVERTLEHQGHGLHAAMGMGVEPAGRLKPIFREPEKGRLPREILAQNETLRSYLFIWAEFDRSFNAIGAALHGPTIRKTHEICMTR